MELRLWICSVVVLPLAVKGLKIKDVNPKSQTISPGGKVELAVTWEAESDSENTSQISIGLHLEGSLFNGIVLPVPLSKSPSQVTFNNVAPGKYTVYAIANRIDEQIGVSPDTIEIKAQDPPGSTPSPPDTLTDPRNDGPRQTSTNGTPPAVTSVTTQTTSSTTMKTISSEKTDTETSTANVSGTDTSANNSPNNPATSSSISGSFRGSDPSNTLNASSSVNPTETPVAPGMNPGEPGSESKRNNSGGIIGGVIGGLGFLVIVILFLIYLRRRRSKQNSIPEPFSQNDMVRQSDGSKFEYPFAARFNPAYATPKPFTGDLTTLYTSRASSPVDTEAITVTGTEVTEKPHQFSWTDRQMEIEERVQQLQSQLIVLHNLSKFHKSQGEERQIEDIREKIERLNALKSGYWALEQSDERPQEMMY
ncbi:hypothetical protein VNI00_017882 [Paramarasmius palmivorus]|uniref:Uncharacterized protein n=1 Tax=Paramarasmius palmivorus TaxID=297713 RepID=A0AAW0B4D8_9AGAR